MTRAAGSAGTPDPGAAPGAEPSFFTRNGSIECVDLVGNRRLIVAQGAFTTSKQLTAEFADGKLYWCDCEGMQVLRADLNGSNLQTLIVTAVGDDAARHARNHAVDVAVDPTRRMVYWSHKGAPNAGEGRGFRASIPPGRSAAARDGGTERELITLAPTPAAWSSQTSESLVSGNAQAFAVADGKALM